MPYCNLCGDRFDVSVLGRRRYFCVPCRGMQKHRDVRYAAVTLDYFYHLLAIGEQRGLHTYRDVSTAIGLHYKLFENVIYRLYRGNLTHVRKETASKMAQWERIVEKDGR